MALGFVGKILFQKAFNHIDHFGDMISRTRFHIGFEGIQGRHIPVVNIGRSFGDGADILTGFRRLGVDLVIDVCDVANVGYL